MGGTFKQVTRKDVAREAGVSETVVSYVINNNRYVDKDKRRRVEEAVRKLNYRPNTIARALKGKHTNHIVFIADQIVSEHFSLLVSEMDKHAYDLGYMISLCANRNTQQFVSEIISRRYDGIIISSISFPKKYIQQLVDAKIPVVLLVNRDYDDIENVWKIDNGLYEGTKDIVAYLAAGGCRDIVYVDRFSTRGHFSGADDFRYRGFIDGLKECGLRPGGAGGLEGSPGAHLITGCKTPQEVAEKVQVHLKAHKVDAMVCRSDRIACIAMQAAQAMGLHVPEDVAVAGFDNSTLAQYITPPITSVEIPREPIAKAAIEMLQQMIQQQETPQPVAFATRLIERQSTLRPGPR